MFSKQTVAFAAAISSASAAIYQGFNYDAAVNFDQEFALAKSLAGTNGAFASARLYTSIEPNTANSYISAFQAAIDQDVTLLLGLWGSSGAGTIQNEITAIQSAISTLGSAFTSRVIGISVGSEDLYRNSATGILNKSGVGANPSDIVDYINTVRSALSGGPLGGVPIGHVDTFTAWINGSNSAVVEAVDFLGMDAYPYFQNTQQNDIGSAPDLFFSAYDQTVAVSTGKPVWVTETGWPASGPTSGDAVTGVANAETYWQAVACKLLGVTNTWWYTLDDQGASPSFGVTDGSSTPLYNLACSASSSSSSSSSAAPSTSSSVAAASSSVAASTSSAAKSSVAASSSAAASSAAASSAAASSAAASTSAHESTATPSNTIFSVTSSAVASQNGGGSPGGSSIAAQFSSTGAFSAALTSAPSASATVAASAKSSAAATTVSTMVSSSTSGSASSSTATVSPYKGAASIATAGSTGAIVAAIMALFAF